MDLINRICNYHNFDRAHHVRVFVLLFENFLLYIFELIAKFCNGTALARSVPKLSDSFLHAIDLYAVHDTLMSASSRRLVWLMSCTVSMA